MSKKWKAGVKYTFKDRDGFIAFHHRNTELAYLLGDEFTPLEIYTADGSFIHVKTKYSDHVKLPAYVISVERKYFKRVK